MRKRIDPNRKITQVADPEFYRLSDPFFKYLLAKEEHADLCNDFTKAVVDHIPLAFRSREARDFSDLCGRLPCSDAHCYNTHTLAFYEAC